MLFRSPLPSLGLLKTVTHVLAILLPMSWPRFVTYVLATDLSDPSPTIRGINHRRAGVSDLHGFESVYASLRDECPYRNEGVTLTIPCLSKRDPMLSRWPADL